jgi:predicted dehydrogenase
MPSEVSSAPAPLQGAIVGFGNVALNAHVPVLSRDPRFRIAAVVEPDPIRAAIAHRRLPEATLVPSLDAARGECKLDFVDICTPPAAHPALVLQAVSAGLHVLCEKPLTLSLERLREIRQAALDADRVVFTVNNWKHAPLWRRATDLVREKRIGAVRSVRLEVLRCSSAGGGASGWRSCAELAGGGILVDHGWHALYLLMALFPGPPQSVACRLGTPPAGGVEETADLVLGFEDAQAQVHLTWRADQRRNGGEIVGELGTIHIGDGHLVLQSRSAAPLRWEFPQALSAGSHHTDWMGAVVDEFAGEILNPGRRGANLTEACWCGRLIDLAYRCGRGIGDPLPVVGPL